MLDQIWSHDHGTRFIVGIRQGVVKHFQPDSADDAQPLAEQLDREGWDVYYAPASFRGTKREAAGALSVQALWMDLDCGDGKIYDTPEAAMGALLAWLRRHDLPDPTHVVHSGYGLHVYWMLDAAVSLDEWRDAADRFKRAVVLERICDDPGVISDAARILRVPGTHNYKTAEKRAVTLLSASDRRVRLEDFTASLPALGPQRAVPRDDEWSVQSDLPPGDAEAIAEKCAQMRHMRDTAGQLPEPLWRAGLSILQRCENKDDYIHAWSKGDPRYDAEQTRRKAEATAGPATCQHFSELDPERCQGCPLRGTITSPIQIQLAFPEPDEPQEPWRLSRTASFSITSGGVWHQPKDADVTPKRITLVPVWVVEVRERAKRYGNEVDDSTLLIEWVGVDGHRKRAVARQADIYSLDKIKGWAAQENLASAIQDWKLFMTYISQYTLESIKGQGAHRYHETLGWYKEGFVVGGLMVTANGTEKALVQTSNPIGRIRPAEGGSVEGWVAGISAFDRDCYHLHQFAVQCGFASPLFELANLHSAVIALVGPPGTGKTLSADAALSIYGDPQWLRQGAKSSMNAIEKQLGANRNVPHLVDEITQWTPQQAGNICYMAANGQGDAKLTRTRENAEVATWRLTPFVTSNRPLTDYGQTQFTDAHRARLVELFMGQPMSRQDGAQVATAVGEHHYGTAAVPFLQWVCANRTQVPHLIHDSMRQVSRAFDIPDSHRFALWTLGTALAAGAIAYSLKLIPWEPKAAVWAAARSVVQGAGNILPADDLARDILSEWLTEYNEGICFWDKDTRSATMPPRKPVARVLGDGTMALHRAKVNELMADAGVSRRAASKLFAKPNLIEERRLALAPGTSPVWCYVFTEDSLEFTP